MARSVATITASILALYGATSIAKAGFVITEVRTIATPTLDRIDLFARNTGGGTGTQFLGVTLDALFTFGGKSYWNVQDTDDDAIGDSLDLYNAANVANRSSFRPSTTANSAVIYGPIPFSGYQQPNAWTNGIRAMSVLGANVGTPINASTGNGHRFARLFVDTGTTIAATGKATGEVGEGELFTLNSNTPSLSPTVSVSGPGSSSSTFVFDLRRSSNFELLVSAVDPDGSVYNVTMGVPGVALHDNIQISDGPSASKIVKFVGLNLTDVIVGGANWGLDFYAVDNTGRISVKNVDVKIIAPEPAGLTLLCVAAGFVWRRR